MSELKYSKEQIIDACKEAGLGILECNSLITVLGRTQPEATKPAQDLSAAIDWLRNNYQDHTNIASLCDAMCAALASPADALVAGDRVDAELREALEELYYALPDILPAAGYKRLQETGQWSSKTTWDLRGHTGEVKYRADDMQSVYAAMDRVRAAIQAQKDGHG